MRRDLASGRKASPCCLPSPRPWRPAATSPPAPSARSTMNATATQRDRKGPVATNVGCWASPMGGRFRAPTSLRCHYGEVHETSLSLARHTFVTEPSLRPVRLHVMKVADGFGPALRAELQPHGG